MPDRQARAARPGHASHPAVRPERLRVRAGPEEGGGAVPGVHRAAAGIPADRAGRAGGVGLEADRGPLGGFAIRLANVEKEPGADVGSGLDAGSGCRCEHGDFHAAVRTPLAQPTGVEPRTTGKSGSGEPRGAGRRERFRFGNDLPHVGGVPRGADFLSRVVVLGQR